MGITRAFDSATGASGGEADSGGGGLTPLNPPTPPSVASLASGTTTHNFVFNAATGGEGSKTYTSAITQTGSGASISSTTDNGATITVATAGLTDGNDIQVALTATDTESQTATARAFASVQTASSNPPVLANPSVSSITLGDSDPSVTFTNSGGSLTSSSASIADGPAGHTATVSNTSGSLSVTLTSPNKAGTYTVDYTATNADGSSSGRAVFEVASSAPTANAGASQQHTGGTINLNGTGSTATSGRTITGYSWTFASNSPATATLTGATTATPSFTAVAGETYTPQLTVTDSEGETDTATTSIYPAASVTVYNDIDLTDATADASLADGDTIYKSDGTTAIGTMTITNGLTSGSPNHQCSIGTNGLEFTLELTSGSYSWPSASFALSNTSIDMSAEVVMVQMVYEITDVGANTFDGVGVVFGEDGKARAAGSGHNWGCQVWDAPTHNERVGDYPSGTNYNLGTNQASGATLPQSYVCAWVIHAGTVVRGYWRRGDTIFTGVPDPADSDVYVQDMGETTGISTSESQNFGSTWSFGIAGAVYSTGSGNGSSARLKRVRISGAGLGRD